MCDLCPDLTEAEARANSAGSYALAIESLRPAAGPVAVPDGYEGRAVVYFITNGHAEAVKIGRSKNLRTRMGNIGSSSPSSLTLLAYFDGHTAEEAALHKKFAHLRQNGEWFRKDEELSHYIALCKAMGALVGIQVPKRTAKVGPLLDGESGRPSAATFRELIETHGAVLHRRATALCKSRIDAEDLVQDTLERAFRRWSTFDGQNLRAWLMKVMMNIQRDVWRHNAIAAIPKPVEEILPLARAAITPDKIAEDREALFLFGAMKKHHREIMLLWADGLDYAEIAERIGLPIGTVRSRLHRARAKYSKLLRGSHIGERGWRTPSAQCETTTEDPSRSGAIPARFPSAVQPCAADTARLSSRIAAVTLPRGEGRAALSCEGA